MAAVAACQQLSSSLHAGYGHASGDLEKAAELDIAFCNAMVQALAGTQKAFVATSGGARVWQAQPPWARSLPAALTWVDMHAAACSIWEVFACECDGGKRCPDHQHAGTAVLAETQGLADETAPVNWELTGYRLKGEEACLAVRSSPSAPTSTLLIKLTQHCFTEQSITETIATQLLLAPSNASLA